MTLAQERRRRLSPQKHKRNGARFDLDDAGAIEVDATNHEFAERASWEIGGFAKTSSADLRADNIDVLFGNAHLNKISNFATDECSISERSMKIKMLWLHEQLYKTACSWLFADSVHEKQVTVRREDGRALIFENDQLAQEAVARIEMEL